MIPAPISYVALQQFLESYPDLLFTQFNCTGCPVGSALGGRDWAYLDLVDDAPCWPPTFYIWLGRFDSDRAEGLTGKVTGKRALEILEGCTPW